MGTSRTTSTCLHCHLTHRSDHSQLTRHKIWKIWKSGSNFMTLCESMSKIQIETARNFQFAEWCWFLRTPYRTLQNNIFYFVIYRKYKRVRKKGIFVCYFFTGHQITVMDSERQPEAQNEPRASAKSRTMPPNYCRKPAFFSPPPKCHLSFVRIAVFAIAQSCLVSLPTPLSDWLSVSDFPLFAALTEILSLRIE